MFDKTERNRQQAVSPPPNSPVPLTFKGGQTLWNALFSQVDLAQRPAFVVLFVQPTDGDDFALALAEPHNTQTARHEELGRETLQRVVLKPLIARLHDRYSPGTHLILSYRGRVWATDEQDAFTAMETGEPPHDPDELHMSVPPFFDRCWDFSRLFTISRNPRVKAIGLIVFVCVLILAALACAFWVFAVYMLGEAMAAAVHSIIDTYLAFFLLASLGISAFEIVGVFVPPLRPYAYVTSAVDFALHSWYGFDVGAQRLDPDLIQGIWATLFGILSIAPEFCIILFGGMVYYTFPLVWRWLPRQIKRIGKDGWSAWWTPDDDIVEGEYVVQSGRDTRMLRG